MPDPTYKTFLSPGSCKLEITDLVASANDDTGIDLYGVAWEIEQVLIAGEGFAASPTDVWVNERGILNIGQSLFDKINRTALNNTNIPGQCTVVVKATSLVDSSKVARLKVLVGYPSEGGGGGGGGGGSETVDVYMWNVGSIDTYLDARPSFYYYYGIGDIEEITDVENVTHDDDDVTIYGVLLKNIAVGSLITCLDEYDDVALTLGEFGPIDPTQDYFPNGEMTGGQTICAIKPFGDYTATAASYAVKEIL